MADVDAPSDGAPRKRILTQAQLSAFAESPTHTALVAFVRGLNEACRGRKLTDQRAQSTAVSALLTVLDRVAALVEATPAVDNGGSRFGNPAFRTLHDQLAKSAPGWHRELLGQPESSVVELCGYFTEAWGNRERIDYGSGMGARPTVCASSSWQSSTLSAGCARLSSTMQGLSAPSLCLRRREFLADEDLESLAMVVFWRHVEACSRS